mmetsp:Transcript_45201/g.118657  ORF Transcript_45201/g.118657 Transcript_45201/m.118657 type:complete len:319 (-) Transcript_45201:1502-2458(-)
MHSVSGCGFEWIMSLAHPTSHGSPISHGAPTASHDVGVARLASRYCVTLPVPPPSAPVSLAHARIPILELSRPTNNPARARSPKPELRRNATRFLCVNMLKPPCDSRQAKPGHQPIHNPHALVCTARGSPDSTPRPTRRVPSAAPPRTVGGQPSGRLFGAKHVATRARRDRPRSHAQRPREVVGQQEDEQRKPIEGFLRKSACALRERESTRRRRLRHRLAQGTHALRGLEHGRGDGRRKGFAEGDGLSLGREDQSRDENVRGSARLTEQHSERLGDLFGGEGQAHSSRRGADRRMPTPHVHALLEGWEGIDSAHLVR